MNHPTDDELISAYLDGELSGEELLRAERMLEERPECRQLVEELRAIGGGLRDLPRYSLDDDFADRVLRRAEREMLSAVPPEIVPPVMGAKAVTPHETVSQATTHESNAPQTYVQTVKTPIASAPQKKPPAYDEAGTEFQPDLLSWRRWRRPAVWSSLAVAAALLIMFLGSPQMQVWQANTDLVQAPAPHATTDWERTKESATRPAGGADLDERFAQYKDGGGQDRAGAITAGASISSGDTAQQPAAESLAKSAGGTVLDGSWSKKTALPLDLGTDGLRPNEGASDRATRFNYQGDDIKRREENNHYNYFALQPDGQTSPAQPLTNDVLIVQCNVDSVDAANRAFRELLAKQQIAWDNSPTSGSNGDVAAESRKGGAKADSRGGAGLGGGFRDRFGGQGPRGQSAGETGAAVARPAATAKAGELAESKTDAPAAAAELGFLREVEELGINRRLDRTQLDRSRLDRERFDRDDLSIDQSASEKLGVQKQYLDSEKLEQQKASEEVDKRQSFRKAVLVEGTPAQLDALIADMSAQKGVVHEVLLRYAAGTPLNTIADNVSPPSSASLQNVRPEDVATSGAKLDGATIQKQASPNDAFGVDHNYTDSIRLGGVPPATVLPPNAPPPTTLPPSAPLDRPSASPSVTRMPENQPRPAPVAPDARNWAEEDKKTEVAKPAGVTNKAEAARELGNKVIGGSKSGRSELRQMPPGQAMPPDQAKSDKAASDTSASKKAAQKAESTRSQRGANRLRDMRRNKDKAEPPAAPSSAPAAPSLAPAAPAPSAAPKSSASRSLAEPPPAAEKMAEGKAAPPAPVDAKSSPAAPEQSPPAPAAVEQMPPEQAKPQDPTLPQVVAPTDSLPDYVVPTTPRADRPQVAAPADPARRSQALSQSQAASQSQGVQSSNVWYGRAQEVMVPEGALGEPESVQPPRFESPNEAAQSADTADEVHGELFSKKPANQAPSDAPEPPAAQVERKSNTQGVEKSEPVVSELNAADKVPMHSKPAEGRGDGIGAIKSEADGQKEAAVSQSRGMQLRLGEGNRPSGNTTGDGKSGESAPGGAPSHSKNQSRFGDRPVEKKLNDQGIPSQLEALDVPVGRFHDPAPRQVATTPPAPRRVIFVFNVQPPAAAAPVTESVPGVHAAPSPAKAE